MLRWHNGYSSRWKCSTKMGWSCLHLGHLGRCRLSGTYKGRNWEVPQIIMGSNYTSEPDVKIHVHNFGKWMHSHIHKKNMLSGYHFWYCWLMHYIFWNITFINQSLPSLPTIRLADIPPPLKKNYFPTRDDHGGAVGVIKHSGTPGYHNQPPEGIAGWCSSKSFSMQQNHSDCWIEMMRKTGNTECRKHLKLQWNFTENWYEDAFILNQLQMPWYTWMHLQF